MTALAHSLQILATTLQQHRYLWEPEPFLLREAPWGAREPAMQDALLSLSQAEVDAMLSDSCHSETWLAHQLPSLFEVLRQWQPMSFTPQFDHQHDAMSIGIGGRKWLQIQAFHQVTQHLPAVLTCTDWCGGKGYLAAYLASHQGCQVDCIDIDQTLCEEGAQRVDQYDLPVAFHRCDALQPVANDVLANERHVALHACGELHRSLWQQTIGVAEQVCISPCCYHLGASDICQLSEAAKQSDLQLNAKELRIPLLETVTGGQQALRNRRTEQIWRLAYDRWRAEATDDPQYRPLRSVSKSLLKQDPRQFFEWAATLHGLVFDAEDQVELYLIQGERDFAMSERLGIIRQGLKRYLEYFVVLDLACYAEECGYRTNIVAFCDKSLTPRNLAVIAQRPFDPSRLPRLLQ